MSARIKNKFQELKTENETAFIAYICAGDPTAEISTKILDEVASYADIIELGVPFADPAGDGPVIEDASKRAIKNGMTLAKTLKMAKDFRVKNDSTPIILMGYYNSFLKYGLDRFFNEAQEVGIDGLIIVDLPLEERREISTQLENSDISLINLISPLSSQERIAQIVDEQYSSGFLYLVSMLGVTGTKDACAQDSVSALSKVKAASNIPVVIGFGIKNGQIAKDFKNIDPDGIVVGSAIVKEVSAAVDDDLSEKELIENVASKTKEFYDAIKNS